MCRREPLSCIIPPHMLRAMAKSSDSDVRRAALSTLVASARIRGQREIVGRVRTAVLSNAPGRKHRSIYNAAHEMMSEWELPGTLVRDEGQPPSSDPTINEAYDGLGATYDYFAEVFNRNSIDDRGMRLVATVHFGTSFNNAFWNGKQMVFGDGNDIIFAGFTRSLDVIGHELTHGVTEFTSNPEYHKQPGALNESFSDVFGSLVKQYTRKQDAASADWLIGAELLAPGIGGVALRSLKDPGSAYDDPRLGGRDPQPKHMSAFVRLPDDEWNDWGGVHINSGIPNHAFYLVATQLGGNAWEDAGIIWYDSLLQLWRTAQFQDCANITAQVAAARFGTESAQHQAVKTAWARVGVPVAAPSPPRRRDRKPALAEGNGRVLKRQLERLGEELQKTIVALG
ncbi:MAG: M4 family metallopeptidase [Gemmatimonadetes bacterium]|nr:M4 family metallopeptidase [Gemmatimonadota bacterium]